MICYGDCDSKHYAAVEYIKLTLLRKTYESFVVQRQNEVKEGLQSRLFCRRIRLNLSQQR